MIYLKLFYLLPPIEKMSVAAVHCFLLIASGDMYPGVPPLDLIEFVFSLTLSLMPRSKIQIFVWFSSRKPTFSGFKSTQKIEKLNWNQF